MIKKIWRAFTILMTIAALVLVVVGFILPSSVDVEVAADVGAPPEAVFELIDDFDSYKRWSLLAQEEGANVIEPKGPYEGVGAYAEWYDVDTGPRTGRLEIVDLRAPEFVMMSFPLQGAKISEYRLTVEPKGDGSRFVWRFQATFGMDIVARYRGLSLKTWAERDAEVSVANIVRIAEGG